MRAVSQVGLALIYASKELQNDDELLLLLEKDNKEAIEYQREWYEERMRVFDSYKQQEQIESSLDEINISKTKIKKF